MLMDGLSSLRHLINQVFASIGREVPSIELYPEATQTIIRGGSCLFQCRVTAGIPTPTVEWVRADGSPFTSSTEVLNGGVIRYAFNFIK